MLLMIVLCFRAATVGNFRHWLEDKITYSIDVNLNYTQREYNWRKLAMYEPGHTDMCMFWEFWRPLTINEWFDPDPTK